MNSKLSLAVWLAVFACEATLVAGATELRLSTVDPSGKPVALEKAQLILTTWGETKRIDLPFTDNALTVPLDAAWPMSHLPEVHDARLFFKPVGHVPVMTESFAWIGQSALVDGQSEKVTAADIRFQDGTSVRVADGETKDVRLVARRPAPRWVRLVDAEGRPLPRVKVSSYMFWSDYCHTGAMMGSEPLGDATTDKGGRIRVPDGDMEYAFVLLAPHCIFQEPAPRGDDYRNEVTTRLKGEEATLVVRKLKPRPLEMIVTGPDGKPAAGAVLYGSLYGHEAMRNLYSGALATADASGRIRVRDFYPDECGRLFFRGADDKTIWQIDPSALPPQGPLRVELPEAPSPR